MSENGQHTTPCNSLTQVEKRMEGGFKMLGDENKEQWELIRKIEDRVPPSTVFVISLLSGGLGVAVTVVVNLAIALFRSGS